MLREECGIIGIYGDQDAARLSYLGLYALQHRGQEACGIVTVKTNSDEDSLSSHRDYGLVSDVFGSFDFNNLSGDLAIGHVRYSTQGGRSLLNVQPFLFRSARFGPIAIAHNGNLTNAALIRAELEQKGSIFASSSDSEVFTHLIARSKEDSLEECLKEISRKVKGAYSIVIAAQDKLFGVRDPFGFRPLVLGKRNGEYILSSESCALDLIDAQYLRDIKPGEVITISSRSYNSTFLPLQTKARHCSFEPIYFSRPDSLVNKHTIYEYRKKMGAILARENPVEADLVMAIPDSGVPAAVGYAHESGIPLELGLVRNHYVGRTFIEPTQQIRDFRVKLKLNPIRTVLSGKRVVVIDDSLVRGTTSFKIIRMLREAGAKEVHFRVSSPPITHSCYYGVSTPNRQRLIAAQKSVEEIRKELGADSLCYLSLPGLKKLLEEDGGSSHCYACFNGLYPEEIFCKIPAAPVDVKKTIKPMVKIPPQPREPVEAI